MTNTGAVLPIAETFHSIQGEGQWVGTPMHFIRLAGCNVGKPAPALKVEGPFAMLPGGKQASYCSSWDGRVFPCDTDYGLHEKRSVTELVEETWEDHICLTGGEPLIHKDYLGFLLGEASNHHKKIHIETSGTISIIPSIHFVLPWITCAPKVGVLDIMIKRADELKLLVDDHFDPDNFSDAMLHHHNVFLCPINQVTTVDMHNLELCLKWLKKFPKWRLSCQLHKFLGLR